MRCLLWLATLLLSAVAMAQEAPASDETSPEVYDHMVDSAVEEFVRGNWAEARELFERAQAVHPNARALRGLGMADFNLHAYARATAELEAALSTTAQPLDGDLRAQVEALLYRARPYVARVTLRISPEHAALTIDDAPPLRDEQQRVLLELGEHVLRIEAAGYYPRAERVIVRSGGESSLSLSTTALPPPPAPVTVAAPPRRSLRLLRWTSLALGVAALSTGAAARFRSNQRYDALDRRCRAMAGCFDDQANMDPIRRLDRMAYASLSIGAVAMVTAFVSWVIDPSALQEKP